jgi:CHAT domain-containing protein
MGEQATEGRLKKVRSPHILHIATHGFFLNDQGHHPKSNLSWLLDLSPENTYGSGRLLGTLPESPLLRSGLALSGANTWLRGERLPEDAEDGLLTAEDVTSIDLQDTELVVLSACETGLGEVHVGEGVVGLRQSFILAGAQTMVMSLWKVPDLATTVLMDRFYENLFRRKMERNEALRQAQLYIRDVTVAALREDWLNAQTIEKLAHPGTAARRELEEIAANPDTHRPFSDTVYWGAFVCQGNPGCLPGSERFGSSIVGAVSRARQ